MTKTKKVINSVLFLTTAVILSNCSDDRQINLDTGISRYGSWDSIGSLTVSDGNSSHEFLTLSKQAVSATTDNISSVLFFNTAGIGGRDLGAIAVGKYDENNAQLFKGKFYNLATNEVAKPFRLILPATKDNLVATSPQVELNIASKVFVGKFEPSEKTEYFIAEMDFQSAGRIGNLGKTKSDTNDNGFFEEGIAYAYGGLDIIPSTGTGGCKIISKQGTSATLNMKFQILDTKNFLDTPPEKFSDEGVEEFKVRQDAYRNKIKAWQNSSSHYKVEVLDSGSCALKFELKKYDKIKVPTYEITKIENVSTCLTGFTNQGYEGLGSSFKDPIAINFGRFKGAVANGTDAFMLDCEMFKRTYRD